MSTLIVGWIGLGNAGFPMAANLAKADYSLLVHDVDPDREIKFVVEYPKCRVAIPREEAFKACDVIITMLPNGKTVQDVLIGDHGIGRSLRAGIYMSAQITRVADHVQRHRCHRYELILANGHAGTWCRA